MLKYIGVDIGNSGLRIAELDIARRRLGAMRRINWRYAPGQPGNDPRYQPGDSAWLAELDDFFSTESLASQTDATHEHVWLVSCVRRDALAVLESYIARLPACRMELITHRRLPLECHVQSPEKVGIDRLLAAVAAATLSPERPLIVVQAGSAVTVDWLSRDSQRGQDVFEGGAILPGIPMMLRLLGKGADMLPEIDADDLVDLPELPGKNTEQAMSCGAASAFVGGVAHLIERYRAEYGQHVRAIISGGDGMRLAPHVPEPVSVESHLVQRGLLILAGRIDSGTS